MVHKGGASGPSIVGTVVMTAPVAPSTAWVWTLRVRNGPDATTRPANVWVTSSGGGQVGPVTLN